MNDRERRMLLLKGPPVLHDDMQLFSLDTSCSLELGTPRRGAALKSRAQPSA